MTWAPRAAEAIDAGLAERATPERAEHERAYLKSDLHHVGVTVPGIRATVKQVLANDPPPDDRALVGLASTLWDEPAGDPVHERRMAAALVLERADLASSDLVLLERMLREARTWAIVDTIAPRSLAELADRSPDVDAAVAGWASDADVWIRRSALLRHLIPLREGRGSLEAFGAVADPLLEDREFFVRKAIGWVLRDASRRDPEGVATWIAPRAHRMSGLTFREATRRLPEGIQRQLSESRV